MRNWKRGLGVLTLAIILAAPLFLMGGIGKVNNTIPNVDTDGTGGHYNMVELLGVDNAGTVHQLQSDTSGNLTYRPKTLSVSGNGAAVNDTPIAPTNLGDCRAVCVQVTAGFTGNIIFEGSNDNVNWGVVSLNNVLGTPGQNAGLVNNVINPATNTAYYGNCPYQYFRVRVSAVTSGTVTCLALFSSQPIPPNFYNVLFNAQASLSDAYNNPITSAIFALEGGFNGTTWDRWRNNNSLTPLVLQTATVATRTSGDQVNYNGNRLLAHLSIANYAGAASFTLSLQWKDNLGNYVTIWTDAARSANGDYLYALGLGSADLASFTAKAQIPIPRTYRFV
jgi:hypothetical protein